MSHSSQRLCRAASSGFTLIEMMVAIAIVAILTAIAVPSYRNYIIKSHVKGAGADLVALALIMENQHQLTFNYPASTADVTAPASAAGFPGFGPAEKALFTYAVQTPAPAPATAAYLLKATGMTGGMASGCTLTLDSTNLRTVSGGTACGGLTAW